MLSIRDCINELQLTTIRRDLPRPFGSRCPKTTLTGSTAKAKSTVPARQLPEHCTAVDPRCTLYRDRIVAAVTQDVADAERLLGDM